ncbi:MAG: methyltransferase domain-containing protein [Candidatus Omnitrophota bacterium]
MASLGKRSLSIWGVGPVLAVIGGSAVLVFWSMAFFLGFPVLLGVPDFLKWIGFGYGLVGIYFWIASAIMIIRDVPKGKLMTGGVFSFCRNPMYAGFILFILPALTLITGVWVLLSASVVMALIFPVLICKEEDALKGLFGKEYLDYCRRTPMLIPALSRAVEEEGMVCRRFAGKGVFPYQMAFTLLIPLRNMFLSPRTLIERLELKAEHAVLEIGPGPGYFSVPVAKFLSCGVLYLFDIQQEMLDLARQRLEQKELMNARYACADGKVFPYGKGMFDRIFMVTVIGEVEDQAAYVHEIARTLKDDGVVSVSELAGDPDMMKEEDVKALFKTAGLSCVAQYRTLWGYTLNFRKTV